MDRFTTIFLFIARPTRLGLQQQFPTSVLVSIQKSTGFTSLSGSKCVNPPQPDAAQKMIVSWNPDYPPAHNEHITYKCDAGQPYNRFTWMFTWISFFSFGASIPFLDQKTTDNSNLFLCRLVSDFSMDSYQLTCQRDNLFSTPDWPTCAHSEAQL